MSFSNKLETAYLNILRYFILAVATVSLIAVVIAGGMAISAAFSKPPKAQEKIKFEDMAKDLKKGFTVEEFRKDGLPKAEENPQEQTPAQKPVDNAFREFIGSTVSKIADNFITYQKAVSNIELNKEKLEAFIVNFPFKEGIRQDKSVITFYFETLVPLSDDLSKQAPAIANLPEENRLNLDNIMMWHLKKVNKTVETVDETNVRQDAEFQRKQDAYLEKKALTYTFAIFAGAAFGIFLIVIMLFIMVKIERNLRPLQQIADNERTLPA